MIVGKKFSQLVRDNDIGTTFSTAASRSDATGSLFAFFLYYFFTGLYIHAAYVIFKRLLPEEQ